MAATPSIKVVKSFSWRGTARRWSNRYHFNGGVPSDTAHWTVLSDAVVNAEKAVYGSAGITTIVQTIGYAAGSEVPVFTKTYATAGTGYAGVPAFSAGEVALLVRYSTTARTKKNHPIYLFNYYHGIGIAAATTPDVPYGLAVTAFNAYAAAWITGFSDGTTPYVRAGPNGATATGSLVEPYLTHRDFR